MKKFLSICLITAMAGTLFGCSQKEQNMSADSTSSLSSGSSVEASSEEVSEEITIKQVFSQYGIKAGTCLAEEMITNQVSEKILLENFDSVTLENLMKPDNILDKDASVAASDLVVRFNQNTEILLDWAKENDMAVRGHTLVWHSQTPDWIFYENFDTNNSMVSRDVMLSRMESMISQVFATLEEGGYADMFYAYDVVNEAWMEDGSIRAESKWYQTIGEDYLWYAFYYADKYAPEHIELFYNDYNEMFKVDTIKKFVATLVDEEGNSLIDGIGLQGHQYVADDVNNYLNTVEQLAQTGLKIQITEWDLGLGSWPDSAPATDENLRAQGQFYYNLFNGLFKLVEEEKVNLDSFTFWGYLDKLSWRKEASPLLFDEMYQPKYAYYGVIQDKEKAGF